MPRNAFVRKTASTHSPPPEGRWVAAREAGQRQATWPKAGVVPAVEAQANSTRRPGALRGYFTPIFFNSALDSPVAEEMMSTETPRL